MLSIPSTTGRVPAHTAAHVNRNICNQMRDRLRHFEDHPEQIDARLRELDEEWDIERTLEANAATLALTGSLLAAAVDKRFLVLPIVVTAFLLQHAVQGWCPPVPMFRRLGFRTQPEIEEERYALRLLRGDFGHASTGRLDADEAVALVRD